MKRRSLLAAASLALVVSAPGLAQVVDLNDAINKAGRQRMLSQRMAKAWLALVHGVMGDAARRVLDQSMALFDRQLVELKAFAPTPDIRETYQKLETAWSDCKAALVGKSPSKAGAADLLAADAKVLALAHQGTVQLEAVSGKPVGKLVNIAGRQRMLSQRMAKFYLAAMLPVEADNAQSEIAKGRTEFLSAMEVLRTAPETTVRIRNELSLADGQWIFFDSALKKTQRGNDGKTLADVFVASENLLAVMDRVTELYSAVKG